MDSNPPTSGESNSQPVPAPNHNEHLSHRTIVVCLDGTGNHYNERNTNVVNFFSLLKKGNPNQLVYYQPGIGTYTVPPVPASLKSTYKKWTDKLLGQTLEYHVTGAYIFLMENYKQDDKICIFGFSRGAHTARVLAGMIAKVGLLPAGNHQQVDFAFKMYMDIKKPEVIEPSFKTTFAMNVKVEFVGVWDTVDSVGWIPRHCPFARSNPCIKTFRHALALDERRGNFKPYYYDIRHSTNEERYRDMINALCRARPRGVQTKPEPESESTDTLEVWFAGCHSDVGGGSVVNSTRFSLARIPLRWMIRQCYLTQSDIMFDEELLHTIGFDHLLKYDPPGLLSASGVDAKLQPSPSDVYLKDEYTDEQLKQLGWRFRLNNNDAMIKCNKCDDDIDYAMVIHTQFAHEGRNACPNEAGRHVNEAHEELHDALSPIHDQLKTPKTFYYRILECWPFLQFGSDGERTGRRINRGRPRTLTAEERAKIKIHRSVKTRMDAEESLLKGGKYKPALELDAQLIGDEHFVD